MLYRPYRPDDFAPLYVIEEACFEPPLRFSRRYLRQLFLSVKTATWVAEEDGRQAGFGIVEWNRQPEGAIGYIQTLEIAQQFRRRGVGGELLSRLEASAQAAGATRIWLHVDAENKPAIALYRSRGYELQGRQDRYYPNQRAAGIYSRPLSTNT